MADLLRKCEELPMWAFLKGIEGFDTERASECLVKLFHEHYDTVEVLKLATKQDLVEDAGIRAGDALRIVAAAKHHGAVGEADHLQTQTSQARPRAYSPPVMQEHKKARTAAQEDWKTQEQVSAAPSVRVVNQRVAPKQEVAKESKLVKHTSPVPELTNPISLGITYPHTCRLCNIQCLSESDIGVHYNGRIHRAKFAEVLESVTEAKQPAQAQEDATNPAETQEEEKQPTQRVPLHNCGVCNVMCTSEVELRSHFSSQIHIQNMEAATDRTDKIPAASLHCSICDVKSTCKRNLAMHFKGKKHAQKMQVQAAFGDSSYYSEFIREAQLARGGGVAAMAAESRPLLISFS